MPTYSIEPDESGGFQVRVANPDGQQIVGPHFLTLRDAQSWVSEKVRIETDAITSMGSL